MPNEILKAVQWSTNGANVATIERTLARHVNGVDVITLQELSGTDKYSNEAAELAKEYGFNFQFFPGDETPNSGVAVLSPHKLWFPEMYSTPGLIRSLKTEVMTGFGKPRISVVSTLIDPDQVFNHSEPLSEEHLLLQRYISRGLRPGPKDRKHYLVLGNFGYTSKSLKHLEPKFGQMIPAELAEKDTTRIEETTAHAIYIDRHGNQSGLIHLKSEVHPTRSVHPLLVAEFNVGVDWKPQQPFFPIQSEAPQESRPIMLYPQEKPHHNP